MMFRGEPIRMAGRPSFESIAPKMFYNRWDADPALIGVKVVVPEYSGGPMEAVLQWPPGDPLLSVTLDGQRLHTGLRDSAEIQDSKLRVLVELVVLNLRIEANINPETVSPYDPPLQDQLIREEFQARRAWLQVSGLAARMGLMPLRDEL